MSHSETIDDVQRAGAQEPLVYDPRFVLALECDRPHAAGARFSLQGLSELVIGRGARRESLREGTTRKTLKIPAETMSTIHARLAFEGGQWVLEDARSRNGTFVNGERTLRHPLKDGDVVEMGRALFLFRDGMVEGEASADFDAEHQDAEPPGLRTLIPALASQFVALKRVAPSLVPVLILGETGVGKEVVARTVHELSGRTGQFVAVNCGALPPGLVEAQLFGHKKGAFSGATSDEPGFVRLADGGTLFLDEIGEMPKASQTALLRVLQTGEVVPVGSARAIQVNTRIVAATNRTIEEGDPGFRSDLYARLAGFTFTPPPLRMRLDDLGVIIANILATKAKDRASKLKLTSDVGLALLRYPWPLNIRELEQALSTALTLADGDVIRAANLPARILNHTPQAVTPAATKSDDKRASAAPPRGSDPGERGEKKIAKPLSIEEEALRIAVVAALTEHKGNIAAVARTMGKAPIQIHRWLKRFEIDPNTFRSP